MLKIWEVFPKLFALVLADHRTFKMDGTGHPFDHTLSVGQIAANIAEDDLVARLGGAAGLCHNADRLLQRERNASKADSETLVTARDIPKAETVALIMKWLDGSGEFTVEEKERIVNAVLLHSGFNVEGCDPVLVALQDADRCVCSMTSVIMDAAQFWSALPTIDPEWLTGDPTAHSYKNPKSVLKNLECRYDWVDRTSKVCVRLPKAWELMERYVAYIRQFAAEVESQRTEIGLWPDYPVKS
ncbi:MAG: hypothetical protein Q7R63_00055 [bacterium]|nr:hypothetical protein [bacterium]